MFFAPFSECITQDMLLSLILRSYRGITFFASAKGSNVGWNAKISAGELRMMEVYVKNVDGVWFGVACDEQRVFATSFADSEKEALACLLGGVPFNVAFQVVSEGSAFAEHVLSLVKQVYDGKGVTENASLALEHLPAYTQRVLRTVFLIPVGYVASYGAVAEAAGGGARAVGNVMAANPFAPIVPCHRVVSANFGLGGYGGGLGVKAEFLRREKRGYTKQKDVLVDGKSLQVFPVEFVLAKLKKEFHEKA